MKRLVLIIADEEKEYVTALSDFLLENFPGKFSIHTFTSKTSFTKYITEECTHYDILLINPDFYDKSLTDGKQEGIVIFLSEDAGKDGKRDIGTVPCGKETAIYKYQSGKVIAREMSRIYSERKNTGKHIAENIRKTKVIALYSPAGGTGKTTLAISLGIYCARKSLNTLYFNLEEVFSAGRFFDPCPKTGLSSIIYYSKLKDKDIMEKIQATLNTDPDSNLYYIGPPDSVLDLDDFNAEDLQYIFEKIKSSGKYDLVLVDMPVGLSKRNFSIFDACDEILFILSQEPYCREKALLVIKEIERFCHKNGSDYLSKIVPVLNKYKEAGNFINPYVENTHESTGTMDEETIYDAGGILAEGVSNCREEYEDEYSLGRTELIGRIEYKIPYLRHFPLLQNVSKIIKQYISEADQVTSGINEPENNEFGNDNFLKSIRQLGDRYVT